MGGRIIVFTPTGDVREVERAWKAIRNGPPVLGMRSNQYILVATVDQGQRVHMVGEHVVVAVAGSESDGRSIVNDMREEWAEEFEKTGEEWTAREAALHAGEIANRATRLEKIRPYATALIVAGDQGGLYLVDPAGAVSGADFHVTGKGTEKVRRPEDLAEMSEEELEDAARGLLREMGWESLQVKTMKVR